MVRRIFTAIKVRLKRFYLFRINKNPNPVKWGIIGLGNMAEVFSTAIEGNKDGIVYSVASRNLRKAIEFGKKHSCSRVYGKYKDMINDKSLNLDVIYIATPVKYHYDNIKQCLLTGKNVLCEKPITSTASQLEELMVLAKEKGCFLMEGMWMKCLPTFHKAMKMISDGEIGDIQLIKVDFYKRERIRPEMSIYNAEEEGGVLKDYGVYAISFATSFLGGLPDTIVANARTSTFDIDTDWQIFLKKDNLNSFISISSTFASLSKAAIVGSKGTIEWNSQFNRTNTITFYDEFGIQKFRFVAKYTFEGFEHEINEVQKCIKAGYKESSLVPLSESLETLKIIDKIYAEREDTNK